MDCDTDFCDWQFGVDSRNPWGTVGYASLELWRDIRMERDIGEAPVARDRHSLGA